MLLLRSPCTDQLTLCVLFIIDRNDFIEIMEMLDKRLNDKGKNWRHVFKVCRDVVASGYGRLLTSRFADGSVW